MDSVKSEYMPQEIAPSLGPLEFEKDGLNICILCPSSAGKSYYSKALAIESCQTEYRTY